MRNGYLGVYCQNNWPFQAGALINPMIAFLVVECTANI